MPPLTPTVLLDPDGPRIPGEVLLELEEGEVVFFCGAGISRRAGLPGFPKLVCDLYERCTLSLAPVHKAAWKERKYDQLIHLWEQEEPVGEYGIRKEVGEILGRDRPSSGGLANHRALLQLGSVAGRKGCRLRDGENHPLANLRLVTTNYDRLFEWAARKIVDPEESAAEAFSRYEYPALPAASDEWRGLVYLHGRMRAEVERERHGDWILSSADFGKAYLKEASAARFVDQLFQNFTVIFVGYQIGDPVLRYLTDAYAAERRRKGICHRLYAFADYDPGKKDGDEKARAEWEAKGVQPILYPLEQDTNGRPNDHRCLTETLKAWAKHHGDPLQSRDAMVNEALGSPGPAGSAAEYHRSRFLWAVQDPEVAKKLAAMAPLADFQWWEALLEEPAVGVAVAPEGALIGLEDPLAGDAVVPVLPDSLGASGRRIAELRTAQNEERAVLSVGSAHGTTQYRTTKECRQAEWVQARGDLLRGLAEEWRRPALFARCLAEGQGRLPARREWPAALAKAIHRTEKGERSGDSVEREGEGDEAVAADAKPTALSGSSDADKTAPTDSAADTALLRELWQIYLDGQLGQNLRDGRADDLVRDLERAARAGGAEGARADGGAPLVRDALDLGHRLRALLAPRVTVSYPLWQRWASGERSPFVLVNLVQVRPACRGAVQAIGLLRKAPTGWDGAQAGLLTVYEGLLQEVWELHERFERLVGATGGEDWGKQPGSTWVCCREVDGSRVEYWEEDWTLYVHLLAGAIRAAIPEDREAVRAAANRWWTTGPAIFRRLALFEAIEEGGGRNDDWLKRLVDGKRPALWEGEIQAEVLEWVQTVGRKLKEKQTARLEEAILAGPPKGKRKGRREGRGGASAVGGPGDGKKVAVNAQEEWQATLLDALGAADGRLSKDAQGLLDRMKRRGVSISAERALLELRGKWQRPQKPSPHPWPKEPEEILRAVKSREKTDPNDRLGSHRDGWDAHCRRCVGQVAKAFALALQEGNEWKEDGERWGDALGVWVEAPFAGQSMDRLAGLLAQCEPQDLAVLQPGLGRWIEAEAWQRPGVPLTEEQRALVGHWVDGMVKGDRRPVLEKRDGDERKQAGKKGGAGTLDAGVWNELSEKVGRTVLRAWSRSGQAAEDRLENPYREWIAKLVLADHPKNKPDTGLPLARAELARGLEGFYAADPKWTSQHFLPRLRWAEDPEEAATLWSGYLLTLRVQDRVFKELTDDFVAIAEPEHWKRLHEHNRRSRAYQVALAQLALAEDFEPIGKRNLKQCIDNLPREDRGVILWALGQMLTNHGDQASDLWTHNLEPFFRHLWPRDPADQPPNASTSHFPILLFATGKAIQEAFKTLHPLLQPLFRAKPYLKKLESLADERPELTRKILETITDTNTEPREELKALREKVGGSMEPGGSSLKLKI